MTDHPQKNGNEKSRAQAFFKRAKKVAQTGNYDYAINLYLDGIRCAPDDVYNGHIPLREIAFVRQEKGGKKPALRQRLKLLRTKDPVEHMINAELLLAKDPDHLPYAESILKAAVDGQFKTTAKWIADLLFLANKAAKKPSFNLYILLKESYSRVGFFERAITALHQAVLLKPNDSALSDEFKRLEAEKTVATGKYETATNFRESIKNRSQQEMLQAQESVVKTIDYKTSALQKARKLYAEEPNLSKNVHKLADSLTQMETDEAEKEAVELLQDNYENTKDFSYLEKAGRIRIQQAKRHFREAKKNLEQKPNDQNAVNNVKTTQQKLNQIELDHYKKCVENYPTDSRYKYEYGSRLMNKALFDQALPLLQEAKNDPRLKFTSLNKIGLCFFHKKWFPDAIDIFTQAIETYGLKDDVLAKELHYNLALSYEKNEDVGKALEIFRKIAQQDFNYKDVKERVDKLRKI